MTSSLSNKPFDPMLGQEMHGIRQVYVPSRIATSCILVSGFLLAAVVISFVSIRYGYEVYRVNRSWQAVASSPLVGVGALATVLCLGTGGGVWGCLLRPWSMKRLRLDSIPCVWEKPSAKEECSCIECLLCNPVKKS